MSIGKDASPNRRNRWASKRHLVAVKTGNDNSQFNEKIILMAVKILGCKSTVIEGMTVEFTGRAAGSGCG